MSATATKSRPPVQRRAENPTPAAAERMTTDHLRHEIECHLMRSVRYHKARERFFDSWSNWFSFASLMAGTAVVAALLASLPAAIAMTAGAAVAAMQALEMVFRLSAKARDHAGFASEFNALERSLTREADMSAAGLHDLRAEILMIEAREPPVKRYLDLICHNQVALALGIDDLERLTWWQRASAQYLNGDTALQR